MASTRLPTRDRLLDAGSALFRRQGYTATGLKQIATEGGAPIGSLYHFFPGGKDELVRAAVTRSGERYGRLIDRVFERSPDVVEGLLEWFRMAAEALEASDYADGCPIATVALEAAGGDDGVREACGDVFESWLEKVAAELREAGLSAEQARSLAVFALSALEGAFVLARTARSTEPLKRSAELLETTARALFGAQGRPSA